MVDTPQTNEPGAEFLLDGVERETLLEVAAGGIDLQAWAAALAAAVAADQLHPAPPARGQSRPVPGVWWCMVSSPFRGW